MSGRLRNSVPHEHGATLVLLAASVLWGTTGTASALANLAVAPPVVGAARLAGGSLVLIVVCAIARRSALAALWTGDARRYVLAAGAAAALYQAAFFSAVSSTGVAVGTLVVLASAPIACGLLGRWWCGEPLPTRWRAATACAVGGCALLVLPGADASLQPAGVLLAVLAGGCYGVYTVSAKRLLVAGHDPLGVLAGSLGIAALLLAPVLVPNLRPLLAPQGLLLVGWLALAATALAYVLFARGLGRVRAATAGTLSLAEPLTATALGVLILGERLTTESAAGAVLLVVGLVVAALAARPRARTANSPVTQTAGIS